jgi:uncharacterized protein YcaQ
VAAPDSLVISPETARRYLLGRQGLWPGRRWKGKRGAATAIPTIESVQMDPLTIVARSHDLVLWSRVDGYSPTHLDSLMYKERRFFDYGGHLDIYPIEELPYWRALMRHHRGQSDWHDWAAAHPETVDHVRRRVTAEGPLSARDFETATKVTVFSYRGSKETSVALYYLWNTGAFMSHSRRGAERVYDLAERVAPSHLLTEAPLEDATTFLERKWLRAAGLAIAAGSTSLTTYGLHRAAGTLRGNYQVRPRVQRLLDSGHAIPVRIEGLRDQYYAPTEDRPLLESLAAGTLPRAWKPSGPTTDVECALLSPLDNVLDRPRTRALFDFDYLWEIYVTPENRRWGRYTMPVLYRDRLVARFDPRLDRTARVLSLEGFWLEDPRLARDTAFAAALAPALARFAAFHDATLDPGALGPSPLCTRVKRALSRP